MRRPTLALCVLSGIFLVVLAVSQTRLAAQAKPGAIPPMPVPADNLQAEAKIKLGAQLYFEPRLSGDNTISCATCHDPEEAWANHDATDTGFQGRTGTRNSGTVLDSGYMKFQFWDGRATSLEEQALGPIHNPVEMADTLENVVRELNAVEEYRSQFRAVFGTEVTTDGIAKAIAAFERTVVSGPSPYDRHLAGDRTALSDSAKRGLEIFKGKGHCTFCHIGYTLSDQSFHNIGVGMDTPDPDVGREAVTHDSNDRGKFKTPMLRNVALTWPYLHDGSAKTLADVVAFYDRGGVPNPWIDKDVKPLKLTDREKADLVAFLEALTGPLPKIAVPTLPK
jgi:cytochrome c peroxidase